MTPQAPDGTDLVMPRLIVPAYFHPATHPDEWTWLAERPAQIRLVVLNLANGPGAQPDAVVFPVLDRLRSAGLKVAGYVDTNYGHRPASDAVADIGRYLDWYQVGGVFFDRAAVAAEDVGFYAGLAARARDMGAREVALNHGAHPVEVRSRPAGQFFHLLHSVPAASFSDAIWLAARRNAGCVYVTDRGGVNPWDRLPAGELDPQAR